MEHLIHAHSRVKLDSDFCWSYLEMPRRLLLHSFLIYVFVVVLSFYVIYAKFLRFWVWVITTVNGFTRLRIIKYNIRSGWKYCEWMHAWTNSCGNPYYLKKCVFCLHLFALYFIWWELICNLSSYHCLNNTLKLFLYDCFICHYRLKNAVEEKLLSIYSRVLMKRYLKHWVLLFLLFPL